MEINQTYMVILIDTLKKKLLILSDLLELTDFQNKLITERKVDTEEFEGTFVSKQEMIDSLGKADDGFELIYDRVKEELTNHAALYRDEIVILKKLITQITEKNVSLQTAERRNQGLMEHYFADRKREIKDSKMNQKSVSRYYQNMANVFQGESYYLDKKK